MKRKNEQREKEKEKELRYEEWRRILEYDSAGMLGDYLGNSRDHAINHGAMKALSGLEHDWNNSEDPYGTWYGD